MENIERQHSGQHDNKHNVTNSLNTNNDDNEFMNMSDILKRDLNKEDVSDEIFQMQGKNGTNICDIVYLGKYNKIPIENITQYDYPNYPDFKCELFSFTMSKSEIEVESKLKMISFLIHLDNKILASIEYTFVPTAKVIFKKKKRSVFGVKGKYKIFLVHKEKGIYKETVIKEYDEYCGREESIYLLATTIVEDNVIKKYIEECSKKYCR